jgi:mitochondrial fission protein ELM1
LARDLSAGAREWVIDLSPPWAWLPGKLAAPVALLALDAKKDRPAPPWPDLLITCGRRATAVSIAIRSASRGRTRTVHIQNPLTALGAFDLVVAMEHDAIAGPNVISVPTALHDVTPARLAAAARSWRALLAPDGRPLVGVLLGGATKHQPFDVAQVDALIERLQAVRNALSARVAVTPSRRTPPEARRRLAERLADDPDAYVWDFEGENPYLGILALSERLVVTSDSVSMISEALATDAGVEIFGEPAGRKQTAFIGGLIARGLVRPFEGQLAPPALRAPLDATGLAAQAVRVMLAARTGESG